MKKLYYFLIVPAIILASCDKTEDDPEKMITINLGANHTNDIYFEFANSKITSSVRSDWDIAFSVPLQTAGILINEGAGVILYSYGDTNSWDAVDTSGMASWTPAYNDKSDWLNGAFNINSSGGFNYGWATYDHQQTYNVWGDSIYVIQLSDRTLKKLFIRKRNGHTDTYELRWADIDGSNLVDESFSPAEYSETKHFIHYSLVNSEVVEAEPNKDDWDLLFTKYIVKIPYGPVMVDYPVVGVLMKQGLKGVMVKDIDPTLANYSDATTDFASAANIIGWEWKSNDPVTHQTILTENTSYFVKLANEKIYRIYFTDYNSAADGQIVFKVKEVE